MKNWLKLLVSLVVPLIVGGVAGYATTGEINGWFQTIEKPRWQPPNWLFAPVWTMLYILMGIAFYLIWKSKDSAEKRLSTWLWCIQLALNFCWTFIFFSFHQVLWALIEIGLLWIMILFTIIAFSRVNRLAALLLLPYLLWVSFATALTVAIYKLN